MLMAKFDATRRRFLTQTAQTIAATPPLLFAGRNAWAQAPGAPSNLRLGSAKKVLSAADFTYLGAFRMPFSAGGQGAGFGKGLTFRNVGNDLRFLSSTINLGVYEVVYP